MALSAQRPTRKIGSQALHLPAATPTQPGVLNRDVTLLALSQLSGTADALTSWGKADAAAIHGEAGRQLVRRADAVALLGNDAERLTNGIELVPFLAPGGAFGPAWPGHPFASSAMNVGYKLREPDVTRELARLMGPSAGWRGPKRAISFLRLISELAGLHAVEEMITDNIRPTVISEHPVAGPRRRAPSGGPALSASTSRIDLLFEWPLADGRRTVVVIEAKLGAVVSDVQLTPYRLEALRRAKGGPVGLILLTAKVDAAERRYRKWSAVRWFAMLRRWETILAEANDDDPEFTRVRAHLWRFVLTAGRVQQ